jgi:antitoxin component of MazEF toxin-antitoxin module
VPKALRDELSLTPSVELELTAVGGHLEIEPVPRPMRLERRDGRLVATADGDFPPLTQEDVRSTLELVREKR